MRKKVQSNQNPSTDKLYNVLACECLIAGSNLDEQFVYDDGFQERNCIILQRHVIYTAARASATLAQG